MARRTLGPCVLTALLLVPAGARGQAAKHYESDTLHPPVKSSAKAPDVLAAGSAIVEQTNAFRKQQGRAPVKLNAELARTARYFADFMARTDKYGHTADGKQPWDRAEEHGYEYCILLENIAWEFKSTGFTTAELAKSFVQGWEKSPGHRRNMLDADVVDTGVAVAHSTHSGRYYAVQMFGRPRSAAVVFKIANNTEKEIAYTVNGKKRTLPAGYAVTHTRCRRPDLRFPNLGGRTFHPADGSRYVVAADKAGKLTVSGK